MSNNDSSSNNEYHVSAVIRAIHIIDFMYEKGGSASINEISKELGMYKSTVHRILNTLKSQNYVHHDQDDPKYHLGIRFYTLGSLVKENLDILQMFTNLANNISDKYNEGVQISVLDKNSKDAAKLICIQRTTSSENLVLRTVPAIGIPTYCHCSASGKCLLAFSDPEYIDQFRGKPLQKLTDHTITDWNKLDESLKEIRELHYGIDVDEREIGLMCIAVPVIGRDGYAVAAVSLQGPTSRVKKINKNKAVNDLTALSKKLEPYASSLITT